jgi:iron(III) transport system permease protein
MKRVTQILKGLKGLGWEAHRPPPIVWLPAFMIAAAMILPPGYLVLRTFGAGAELFDLVFRIRTLQVLGRTLILIIGVAGVSVAVSLPLAWLTIRTDVPLRRLWSVLTALPLVIPSYVAGFIVVAALGPRGMLQRLLEGLFGVERLPEIYGFPGAMLTIVLVSYPLVLITLQASLRGIDPSLEEASQSLGHGQWHTFRRVVLTQLRPAIAAGALLVALYTLRDFGAVSLLRYETFTWAIYLQYETSFDRTVAAGLSMVLIGVALAILYIEARARGKARYHRSSAGAKRPPALVRLGRWRWPAFGFCAGITLMALFIPITVLVYWLFQGVTRGESLHLVLGPAINSIYASGLAAAAAALFSLPVAILAVRYPGRISAFVERSTYIGFALPGIVVALALVFFGAHYATPIYQTLWLLIFAYLILFMPQAVGACRASLLQVSPRVEEAARSLGRTPLQVLGTITLPLVRSGILAGAILIFFTTMKELPATLILSPIGFKTLAISIWSATSEAFFARAAAPALLLILISAVPMAFLTLRERR